MFSDSAASKDTASTSAAPAQKEGKKKKQQGEKPQQGASAETSQQKKQKQQPSTDGGAKASASAAAPAAAGQGQSALSPADAFRPCRYNMLYRDVLYRELMLKEGTPKTWEAVPKVESVTLTITTREDMRLGIESAPKEDLLLYLLALEHVSGQPAEFLMPPNRALKANAMGVTTTMKGQTALNFLEKLVYLILPNQIGFEAASYPELIVKRAEDMTKAERRGVAKRQPQQHVAELRVSNMLLYPDFEQNFNLFEALRSMHVRIVVQGASSPDMARMLLTGMQLPVAAEAAREAVTPTAAYGSPEYWQQINAEKNKAAAAAKAGSRR